jgi:hypothetical protein
MEKISEVRGEIGETLHIPPPPHILPIKLYLMLVFLAFLHMFFNPTWFYIK